MSPSARPFLALALLAAVSALAAEEAHGASPAPSLGALPASSTSASPASSTSALPAQADLVVLAQPVGPPQADRQTYDVLEIFAGEPPGPSITVAHPGLGAEDRARLAQGDRVLLLAHREPGGSGLTAPVPLRATPDAIAAFRRWSAPDDVKSARSSVGAVTESNARPPATSARREPAQPHAPARAPEPVAAARAPVAPAVARATPPRSHAPAASPPIATALAAAPGVATSGPGLPPRPDGTPLGPSLASREDLPVPRRGGRSR